MNVTYVDLYTIQKKYKLPNEICTYKPFGSRKMKSTYSRKLEDHAYIDPCHKTLEMIIDTFNE